MLDIGKLKNPSIFRQFLCNGTPNSSLSLKETDIEGTESGGKRTDFGLSQSRHMLQFPKRMNPVRDQACVATSNLEFIEPEKYPVCNNPGCSLNDLPMKATLVCFEIRTTCLLSATFSNTGRL